MTLEELKSRCENEGFKYAYGNFKKSVKPPYLVVAETSQESFKADNIVYFKRTSVELVYIYLDKDIEEQKKIEENILKDIVWKKDDETYYSDDKVWGISYFFEI